MRGLGDTLREAVERHGEKVVLLCSFQKEESVLIDELLRIGDGKTPVRIATIDTGVLFPETLTTWRAFEERFGIEVEVHDASNPSAPWSGPKHCCSVAKVAALEQALHSVLDTPGVAEDMGRRAFERIQTWSFTEDIQGLRHALAALVPGFEAGETPL